MDAINSIQIIWTVVAFIVFIGVVIWAFSSKRKDDFHEAANYILEDDELNPHPEVEEHKHV